MPPLLRPHQVGCDVSPGIPVTRRPTSLCSRTSTCFCGRTVAKPALTTLIVCPPSSYCPSHRSIHCSFLQYLIYCNMILLSSLFCILSSFPSSTLSLIVASLLCFVNKVVNVEKKKIIIMPVVGIGLLSKDGLLSHVKSMLYPLCLTLVILFIFLSDFVKLIKSQGALKEDQEIIKQSLQSLRKVQDGNATVLRKQHQRNLQTDMILAGLGENCSASERRLEAQLSILKQVGSNQTRDFVHVLRDFKQPYHGHLSIFWFCFQGVHIK